METLKSIGLNKLEFFFDAPVKSAAKIAKTDPINQPPNCPPDVQNGQCHVNRLRKPGYSFSWDWGPSLPDTGIYQIPIVYPLIDWRTLDTRLQLISKYSDSGPKIITVRYTANIFKTLRTYTIFLSMRIQQHNATKKPNGYFELILNNGTKISSTCKQPVANLDKITDHWIVSD